MLPAPSDLDRWRDLLYPVTGRPSEWLSWLEPVWHGEPDVCRVVLYQVYPARGTSPLFWAEDQRMTLATGRPQPDPRFRVSLDPRLLTREQWMLYERFGCMSQPFWIVEGSHGGHKRQFSPVEQRLLGALGLPIDPPVAGSQPFAPVDQRTLDALVPLDEMRMWTKAKELYERTPDDFDRDERDALARGEAKLSRWLQDQVGQAFDDVLTYRKTVYDVFDRAGDAVPDEALATV
jgi:hypothetical protein